MALLNNEPANIHEIMAHYCQCLNEQVAPALNEMAMALTDEEAIMAFEEGGTILGYEVEIMLNMALVDALRARAKAINATKALALIEEQYGEED